MRYLDIYPLSLRLALIAMGSVVLAWAVLSSSPAARAQADCGETPNLEWAKGAGNCLALFTYGADTAGPNPAVVIFLHGDVSRGGPADYHAKYAENLVEAAGGGLIAIAMVRPGYPAGDGRTSGGDLLNRQDHYTAGNLDIVAEAARALKAHYAARRLVMVGHSGGAATVAVIQGRNPGIMEASVLISCPCNLDDWRVARSPWSRSLSPHRFREGVPKTDTVLAITGASDDNTRWTLAEDHVDDLTALGVTAEFQRVSGSGHNLNDRFWANGDMANRILTLARAD